MSGRKRVVAFHVSPRVGGGLAERFCRVARARSASRRRRPGCPRETTSPGGRLGCPAPQRHARSGWRPQGRPLEHLPDVSTATPECSSRIFHGAHPPPNACARLVPKPSSRADTHCPASYASRTHTDQAPTSLLRKQDPRQLHTRCISGPLEVVVTSCFPPWWPPGRPPGHQEVEECTGGGVWRASGANGTGPGLTVGPGCSPRPRSGRRGPRSRAAARRAERLLHGPRKRHLRLVRRRCHRCRTRQGAAMMLGDVPAPRPAYRAYGYLLHLVDGQPPSAVADVGAPLPAVNEVRPG